jgi:hypothetical protein
MKKLSPPDMWGLHTFVSLHLSSVVSAFCKKKFIKTISFIIFYVFVEITITTKKLNLSSILIE